MGQVKILVKNTFKTKDENLKITYTQKWAEFINRKENAKNNIQPS